MTRTMKKAVATVALLLVAVLSFTFIAEHASAISTHEKDIASIDRKAEDVLRLTGAATLASVGVSAIPDDTATPLAEKLADFTQWFLIVLCVLYAEKYMLTLMGIVSFRILIPVACISCIATLWIRERNHDMLVAFLKRLSLKVGVFAVLAYLAVPAGIRMSDVVYETFDAKAQIEKTADLAQEVSDKTAAVTSNDDQGFLSSILSQIGESITSLTNRAVNAVNNFVETLAVMLVASCLIPVLTMLLMFWLVKVFTGINIQSGSMITARLLPPARKDSRRPDAPQAPESSEAELVQVE